MSEQLVIQNFKYGRDARREQLTSQVGVLVKCENAHIDAGGEIEKRMAFVRQNDDAHRADPTSCFDLLGTDSGLLTFGSADGSAFLLPTGVTYQRLQPPVAFVGIVPIVMVRVEFALNFNGKAFVAATFSDNRTFLYYNGTIIYETQNGLVIGTRTSTAAQATELAAEINRISGWVATVSDSTVTVKSPYGITFTLIFTKSTAAGLVGNSNTGGSSNGTAAQRASAKFQVINGSVGVDTFSATAFSDVAGTVSVTLCSGVLCGASASATAAAVVAAINANAPITGYTAENPSTDKVLVYAPISLGNVTFNLSVTTTGTADTGASTTGGTLTAVLSPNAVNKIVVDSSNFVTVRSDPVQAIPTAGTSPYTYTWTEVNADGTAVTTPTGITMSNASGQTNVFSKVLHVQTAVTGYFKCVVADSAAGSASVYITINLEHTNNL
jgi:hypothetical protein